MQATKKNPQDVLAFFHLLQGRYRLPRFGPTILGLGLLNLVLLIGMFLVGRRGSEIWIGAALGGGLLLVGLLMRAMEPTTIVMGPDELVWESATGRLGGVRYETVTGFDTVSIRSGSSLVLETSSGRVTVRLTPEMLAAMRQADPALLQRLDLQLLRV